jgi:hypothetical protein
MKLPLMIPIAIGLVLTAVIIVGPITDNAYAAVSSRGRGRDSVGSLGQQGALVRASGVTTGAGSNVGGVDRNLFCDTGVITPICK